MVLVPTPGFSGYSVEWSPFDPRRLACAAAQHFGVIGNGRLMIMDATIDEARVQVRAGGVLWFCW